MRDQEPCVSLRDGASEALCIGRRDRIGGLFESRRSGKQCGLTMYIEQRQDVGADETRRPCPFGEGFGLDASIEGIRRGFGVVGKMFQKIRGEAGLDKASSVRSALTDVDESNEL